MGNLVSGEAFVDLFRRFEHTAYRLEVRTSYGSSEEDDAFPRFLAGEDPGLDWFEPWLDLMREQTGHGKRVERVRLIDDPPSDYLRFELWGTPHNLAAGEDIRYLDRRKAPELDLPTHDYWLFDSRLVARLEFGQQDRFLGVTLDETPSIVVRHCYWRDAAWHHAETFDHYRERTTIRT
ncbi:DUF6879 family protein [Actinopolymorpha sp. B9G3]|uniref:DUF6879 family protein n=1 Tax=Actinopolymorpha sp. B9G3 TaxID=3158970 RepID=UPI0032D9232F